MSTSKKTAARIRRGIISLLLVLHLFVIVVLPNQMSVLTQRWKPIFEPYQYFLELTANWNFFAPEPGPPPLYLEWELQGPSGEDLGIHQFPDFRHPYALWERQNRRVAIARFMFTGDERYVRVWGDYVCRTNPAAHSVRLWKVILEVPSRSDVAEGRKTIGDYAVAERRSAGSVYCEDYR